MHPLRLSRLRRLRAGHRRGSAAINQCPPGGAEGIARLSAITGQPALPLSAEHGEEAPRAVAFIDESWCIGCTLCIKACPTDAIVGSNKQMHTVIEPYCTGCELCIPACPVDCIKLENVSGAATGWAAWSAPLALQARQRYRQHRARVPLESRGRRGRRNCQAAGARRRATSAQRRFRQWQKPTKPRKRRRCARPP